MRAAAGYRNVLCDVPVVHAVKLSATSARFPRQRCPARAHPTTTLVRISSGGSLKPLPSGARLSHRHRADRASCTSSTATAAVSITYARLWCRGASVISCSSVGTCAIWGARRRRFRLSSYMRPTRPGAIFWVACARFVALVTSTTYRAVATASPALATLDVAYSLRCDLSFAAAHLSRRAGVTAAR